jgi:hypothetical protein
VSDAPTKAGDSRDYFEGHLSFAQRIDLLSGAAEDHGVSGLKPDHRESSTRGHNHQVVNGRLGNFFPPAALAHADDQRLLSGHIQDRLRHQVVVQHDPGFRQ